MAHATAYPSLLHALQFFLDWPALDRATELLLARHGEIDGDHYEYLAPAAEALSERHPLAVTLGAPRAMIDFMLTRSQAKLYRYAAAHMVACARLARDIPYFGAFETHDAYVAPAEGGTRQEVRFLVAHRRLMVVLPEHQVSARWKHCGSKRPKNAAQIVPNRAKLPSRGWRRNCRKSRNNSHSSVIVHGSFDTTHNLTVTSSNTVLLIKIFSYNSSLRSARYGAFACAQSTSTPHQRSAGSLA